MSTTKKTEKPKKPNLWRRLLGGLHKAEQVVVGKPLDVLVSKPVGNLWLLVDRYLIGTTAGRLLLIAALTPAVGPVLANGLADPVNAILEAITTADAVL